MSAAVSRPAAMPDPGGFRVSWHHRHGWRWWAPGEAIPAGELSVQSATPEESEVARRIVGSRRHPPPLTLGDKMAALLAKRGAP